MSFPTTVQFCGIEASQALRSMIDERAQRLGRFASDIHSCRVVMTADRHPHHHGDVYRITIQLAVRDGEIVVGDSHAHDPCHQDPYVAVADAFDAARRRVEDHVRRRRSASRPGGG
jgi:ribosome-associated translation inhibitor RaiA